ncbi:hypothetical protein K438DRAFT_1783177 [Mycena galopus ATCC 62051]|nr:hypothetical protein K438DRAFT_1783177 [Mycena galopus ATCC 62051]
MVTYERCARAYGLVSGTQHSDASKPRRTRARRGDDRSKYAYTMRARQTQDMRDRKSQWGEEPRISSTAAAGDQRRRILLHTSARRTMDMGRVRHVRTAVARGGTGESRAGQDRFEVKVGSNRDTYLFLSSNGTSTAISPADEWVRVLRYNFDSSASGQVSGEDAEVFANGRENKH